MIVRLDSIIFKRFVNISQKIVLNHKLRNISLNFQKVYCDILDIVENHLKINVNFC